MSSLLYDDNRECINNCLGVDGNVFCLEPRTIYGYCCTSENHADCSNKPICTTIAPIGSRGLFLWPCVHEPDFCGE
jgi:hypothetical protein